MNHTDKITNELTYYYGDYYSFIGTITFTLLDDFVRDKRTLSKGFFLLLITINN